MSPGEFWQHRKDRTVVRIEMALEGLLSFSILRGKQWVMCQHIWDEDEFRTKFKRMWPGRVLN